MYLTKLEIPLHSRQAAGFLADGQKMHGMISELFTQARQRENVLYRIHVTRGAVQIYLTSDTPPEHVPPDITLVGQRDLTPWVDEMEAGQFWRFDLLAMPAKKVYQAKRGRNSKRRVLREPEARMDWLHRQAGQNGFSVAQAEELECRRVFVRHSAAKGGTAYLDAFHFEGVLRIADTERFRAALQTGIGPGKAYGLGMMMVRQ